MCTIHSGHTAATLCHKARQAGEAACAKGLSAGAIAHAMELAMEDNDEIVEPHMQGALLREAEQMVSARTKAA